MFETRLPFTTSLNNLPVSHPLTDVFQDWYPKRLIWGDQAPDLVWQYVGDAKFSDPFYLDTLSRSLSNIHDRAPLMKTSLSIIDAFSAQLNPPTPDGFIFHMSRCGSTLVANMLRSNPNHLVMSEPAPVDGVLRSHFKDTSITDTQRKTWLKSMVAILGRQRRQSHSRFFIKLDCWHIAALPFIREVFPDTPCLFLYRSPAEVLASHQKLEGNQMVPGLIEAQWYSDEPHAVQDMVPTEYGIWVMEQILKAALTNYQVHKLLLVDYAELPKAYSERIAPFFNIPKEEIKVEELKNALSTHSKNRGEAFSNDKAEKQKIARSIYSDTQLEHLNHLYAELHNAQVNQHLRGSPLE